MSWCVACWCVASDKIVCTFDIYFVRFSQTTQPTNQPTNPKQLLKLNEKTIELLTELAPLRIRVSNSFVGEKAHREILDDDKCLVCQLGFRVSAMVCNH
jgi:hypothetical protein